MQIINELILCFALLCGSQSAIPEPNYIGYAAFYNPGVMEHVAQNRGLPIIDCMVASPYEKVDTKLTLKSRYNDAVRNCTVYDIAAPQDRQSIIRRGIVVELDWKSAGVLCGISKKRIEPPKACTVEVYK